MTESFTALKQREKRERDIPLVLLLLNEGEIGVFALGFGGHGLMNGPSGGFFIRSFLVSTFFFLGFTILFQNFEEYGPNSKI